MDELEVRAAGLPEDDTQHDLTVDAQRRGVHVEELVSCVVAVGVRRRTQWCCSRVDSRSLRGGRGQEALRVDFTI